MIKSLQSIETMTLGSCVNIDRFHDVIFNNLTNLEYLYIGHPHELNRLDFVFKFPNLKKLRVFSQNITNIDAASQLN